jgi:hypothetical protein
MLAEALADWLEASDPRRSRAGVPTPTRRRSFPGGGLAVVGLKLQQA